MSLKSRFFTVVTVAGATVAFSTIGFAQDKPATTGSTDSVKTEKGEHHRFGKGEGKRGDHDGMRHGGGMGMMLHGLDLTDAQKTQIQSIMAANKPTDTNREEMKSLRAAKEAGTLTDAQKESIKAFRSEREAKRQAIHEQIMAVLTPEQKATLESRKAEMKARKQEHKMMHQKTAPAATTEKPAN